MVVHRVCHVMIVISYFVAAAGSEAPSKVYMQQGWTSWLLACKLLNLHFTCTVCVVVSAHNLASHEWRHGLRGTPRKARKSRQAVLLVAVFLVMKTGKVMGSDTPVVLRLQPRRMCCVWQAGCVVFWLMPNGTGMVASYTCAIRLVLAGMCFEPIVCLCVCTLTLTLTHTHTLSLSLCLSLSLSVRG